MERDQFLGLLERLKLRPASKRTAKAFGLSLRQLQRIIAKEAPAPVPRPVALLAIAYAKRGGVPDILWNPDGSSKDDVLRAATERLLASPTNVVKRADPSPPVAAAPAPARIPPSADPAKLAKEARAAKQARAEKAGERRLGQLRRSGRQK